MAANQPSTSDNWSEPRRDGKTAASVAFATVAILFMIIVLAGVIFGTSFKNKNYQTGKLATPENALDIVDSEPGTAEGFASWRQFLTNASNAQWLALYDLTGMTREDVRSLAAREENGENFVVILPQGTLVTNSGFPAGGGWYPVPGYPVKAGDTTFLSDDKRTARVKRSCGNPVGRPRSGGGREEEEEEEEEGKSSTNSLGDPQDTNSGSPVVGNPPAQSTTGYTDGTAEDTEARRGSGSGSTGNAGSGTSPGATTPSGGTTDRTTGGTEQSTNGTEVDDGLSGQTSSGSGGSVQ